MKNSVSFLFSLLVSLCFFVGVSFAADDAFNAQLKKVLTSKKTWKATVKSINPKLNGQTAVMQCETKDGVTCKIYYGKPDSADYEIWTFKNNLLVQSEYEGGKIVKTEDKKNDRVYDATAKDLTQVTKREYFPTKESITKAGVKPDISWVISATNKNFVYTVMMDELQGDKKTGKRIEKHVFSFEAVN